ncbi:MAG TPA: TIGR04563 family protein [Haliangiales bacterium]|nr:TIGR04563 family protein [Haliangiales bacterium]
MSERKRKVSLYFPADMIQEMEQESQRLERPYYWLLRCAWQIAHREVAALPARTSAPSAASKDEPAKGRPARPPSAARAPRRAGAR